MSGRGARSFRYGARLTVTIPLAAVFIAAATEMVVLALSASLYWRIAFVIIASLVTLFALAMVREVLVRVRGKRQIVIAARTLIMPGADRGSAVVTIPYRDIRKLELSAGGGGFKRVLKIGHTHGELVISGVMLGSVGELDEIHGLIKAARKTR
jgi:hypothetical protein